MTTTWEAHTGLDYTVVMADGENTENASITCSGPGREALGVRVAALLNAAERIRDVMEAYIAPLTDAGYSSPALDEPYDPEGDEELSYCDRCGADGNG